MKIIILGNGGGMNQGLPYNSFLINSNTLIETPPDIMLSLQREKINYSEINEIYISHIHGDHSFGFPFLALTLYAEDIAGGNANKIKVYLPQGGIDYISDICRKAVNMDNYSDWINDKFDFIQINNTSEIVLAGFNATLHKMDHFQETYGFSLFSNNRNIFSYIADTKWCTTVEAVISESPDYIILDMNGEPFDRVPVHISERELVDYLDKHNNITTRFLGTHLKYQKKSNHKNIEYVFPGMVIEI